MLEDCSYIIYEVLHNRRCVYIGSGKRDRYKHAMSGKSNNVELNRLYFTDPDNVVVNIIRENLTKQESLDMEKEYIQATEPKFNKTHTNRHRKIKRMLL